MRSYRTIARPGMRPKVQRATALLLGPRRDALSGVSTHLSLLLGSRLAEEFALIHFEVGSEGRNEGALGRVVRLIVSPFRLAAAVLAFNTSTCRILSNRSICKAMTTSKCFARSRASFSMPDIRAFRNLLL